MCFSQTAVGRQLAFQSTDHNALVKIFLHKGIISNLDEISRIAEVDSYRRYLASLAIVSDFDVKVQNNRQLACVYFVCEEQPLFLYRFDGSMGWQKKINLEDYLQGAPELESDVVTGAWHILKLGSDCYLQQNYRIGPGYLGVLLSLETLLEGRQGEESAESIYLFTDEDGQVLISENDVEFSMGDTVKNSETYVPAGNGDYVMFTQEMGVAGLRLSCAVPSEDVYAGMQRMQYLLGGIALGALLLVVLLGIYLHRNIVRPLQTLALATCQIEKGNIDYQIQADPHLAKEFLDLIGLFNGMTKEIKNLKIQNYEEMLERKNAELKYLQMQLRPHFYLNAITTISSLSMRGENEKIQEFIQALSDYLRYLLSDNRTQATVEGEVRHAVAFIRLQQIRHQDKIFYYHWVDQDVAQVPIQRLLVQTFVENIFKHAFDGETEISIFIRARRVRRKGEDMAQIILVIVQLWKTVGYNSIVYIASITGIDPSLYEAARIDGASRWQQIKKITLPSLRPLITLMILMSCGRIFNSDFGLFYQMPQNSGALFSVTQTIDTYVYRGLMENNNVGMSSAAGLFQSVVGFLFVMVANAIVRKTNKEDALF